MVNIIFFSFFFFYLSFCDSLARVLICIKLEFWDLCTIFRVVCSAHKLLRVNIRAESLTINTQVRAVSHNASRRGLPSLFSFYPLIVGVSEKQIQARDAVAFYNHRLERAGKAAEKHTLKCV